MLDEFILGIIVLFVFFLASCLKNYFNKKRRSHMDCPICENGKYFATSDLKNRYEQSPDKRMCRDCFEHLSKLAL